MAASTRSRVAGFTLGWSFSTRETVWCETPAASATSAMTGARPFPVECMGKLIAQTFWRVKACGPVRREPPVTLWKHPVLSAWWARARPSGYHLGHYEQSRAAEGARPGPGADLDGHADGHRARHRRRAGHQYPAHRTFRLPARDHGGLRDRTADVVRRRLEPRRHDRGGLVLPGPAAPGRGALDPARAAVRRRRRA